MDYFQRTAVFRGGRGRKALLRFEGGIMSENKENMAEDEVFRQEVSPDELDSAAGGSKRFLLD